MKSSLPQIFRKDLKLLKEPQKQSSQFSLYLRTNNFRPHETTTDQNRYNKTSRPHLSKSMDNYLSQTKDIKFTEEFQTKDSLKRLLSQRKTTRSRSFFIEQKQNDQVEQIDSFKTIRKRVLQELTILQKSLPIIAKMQSNIKSDMEEFKARQFDGLTSFETEMRIKLAILLNSFKMLKKQTKTEVKVNKDQLDFIKEEFVTYRNLVEGFEGQQSKFRFEITNGSVPVPGNEKR